MKSLSVTIRMKATEQYFPVKLFVLRYFSILKLGIWSLFFESDKGSIPAKEISVNHGLLDALL